jgi:hypothetical protein
MLRRDLEAAGADWIVQSCADIVASVNDDGLLLQLSL